MRKNILLVINALVLLLLLIVFIIYSWTDTTKEASDSGTSPDWKNNGSQTGRLEAAAQNDPNYTDFVAAHLTPIVFYGKVVDQNGLPVSEATVAYRGNNVPWGGGVRSELKTGVNGEFVINTRGLSLFVGVSKVGYRDLPRRSDLPPEKTVNIAKSSGTFQFAKLFGDAAHKADKSSPVIFTLHKSGILEPLISRPGKDIVLSKDGTPGAVELNPGNPVSSVQMQCWTYDKERDAERHYDWRFKISVHQGGLIERLDEMAFVAPGEGYQPVFEHSMSKRSVGSSWKYDITRSFFVRFADQTHAVLNIRMTTGGDHFATVESHLNPKPGSRNLETPGPNRPRVR